MKIALVGRDAHRVLAFRGSLIRLAQREGHEVIAVTGPATGDEVLALRQVVPDRAAVRPPAFRARTDAIPRQGVEVTLVIKASP